MERANNGYFGGQKFDYAKQELVSRLRCRTIAKSITVQGKRHLKQQSRIQDYFALILVSIFCWTGVPGRLCSKWK